MSSWEDNLSGRDRVGFSLPTSCLVNLAWRWEPAIKCFFFAADVACRNESFQTDTTGQQNMEPFSREPICRVGAVWQCTVICRQTHSWRVWCCVAGCKYKLTDLWTTSRRDVAFSGLIYSRWQITLKPAMGSGRNYNQRWWIVFSITDIVFGNEVTTNWIENSLRNLQFDRKLTDQFIAGLFKQHTLNQKRYRFRGKDWRFSRILYSPKSIQLS
jgi:hypothetical protein